MLKKEKNRYITFKVYSSGSVNWYNLKDSIMNALEKWLGEIGLATAKVEILRNLWNAKTQTGIIKCSHRYVDNIKIGLALITQIGDEKVVFQVQRVSGTIKSATHHLTNNEWRI